MSGSTDETHQDLASLFIPPKSLKGKKRFHKPEARWAAKVAVKSHLLVNICVSLKKCR
jgi:hypothetical protein